MIYNFDKYAKYTVTFLSFCWCGHVWLSPGDAIVTAPPLYLWGLPWLTRPRSRPVRGVWSHYEVRVLKGHGCWSSTFHVTVDRPRRLSGCLFLLHYLFGAAWSCSYLLLLFLAVVLVLLFVAVVVVVVGKAWPLALTCGWPSHPTPCLRPRIEHYWGTEEGVNSQIEAQPECIQ